ncbi:hypothetical protein K493DRAFT_305205 [Basidiobolus meristosporus CBS 931.73]|uniref:Uncharacterized protein n=1 Tax=Basidiobolus meristosporus CBS 931.73 TaxID=1314790 RepID=A0A1Y1XWD4_9FUNG|nr:hypothetical protein K493DRAFT_305205 [Basidiobolus meristosporus CBS 931.73]|eukprot:ORX90087.1 hypothetical protein K493DRAFT_305205 [Basidiobolus meristosporus CBS 931.73]
MSNLADPPKHNIPLPLIHTNAAMQLTKLTLITALIAGIMAQSPTPTVVTTTSPGSTATTPATTTANNGGVFPSIWNKVTSGIASVPSHVRNATEDVFGNSGERVNLSLGSVMLTGGVLLYQMNA